MSLSKENKIGQTVVDQSKDKISLIEEDQILQTVFTEFKKDEHLISGGSICQTVFSESKDTLSLHHYDIEGIENILLQVMVKLTLPEVNDQIYASKYEMILPSKQDLIRLIKEK